MFCPRNCKILSRGFSCNVHAQGLRKSFWFCICRKSKWARFDSWFFVGKRLFCGVPSWRRTRVPACSIVSFLADSAKAGTNACCGENENTFCFSLQHPTFLQIRVEKLFIWWPEEAFSRIVCRVKGLSWPRWKCLFLHVTALIQNAFSTAAASTAAEKALQLFYFGLVSRCCCS